MKSNSQPKSHHYLSEFYLRGFCKKGTHYLHVYDKLRKKYRRQLPKEIATINYYYAFKSNTEDKDLRLETIFSNIETKARPVIEKINNRLVIDDIEKEVLAIFIGFAFTRVPKFEQSCKQNADQALKSIIRAAANDRESTDEYLKKYVIETGTPVINYDNYLKFLNSEDYQFVLSRNETIKRMLYEGLEVGKKLYKMNWYLVYAPQNKSFITSDNPLLLGIPRGSIHIKDVTFDSAGASKIIPLSQNVCLIMGDYGEDRKQLFPNSSIMRSINLSILANSHELIIARDKLLLESLIEHK